MRPLRPTPTAHRATRTRRWLAGTLLGCLALGASALPGDRDQPIHIAADQALRDEQKGHTVYSGNVRMVQGSMEVDADRVTIWHNEEDADKIVARGAPARMRQRPEVDQGLVHAQADTITYWQRAQKVNLTSNARIEQRGDVVTGDLIVYYIEKQLVKAESGKREDGNRVNVIIQPSTQQGERAIEPAGVADATTAQAPEADAPDPVEPATDAVPAPSPAAQDEEPSGAAESQ